MTKNYYTVQEVAEFLGSGIDKAYLEIRRINRELKAQGYSVCAGRVNSIEWRKRYSMSDED